MHDSQSNQRASININTFNKKVVVGLKNNRFPITNKISFESHVLFRNHKSHDLAMICVICVLIDRTNMPFGNRNHSSMVFGL